MVEAAVASPPNKKLFPQLLKSSPARLPVPLLRNGEPTTGVRAPVAASTVKTEALVSFDVARNWPLDEIFIPAIGVQQFGVVPAKESAPLAAMLKVCICPLLEAIRNFPSGVAASEIPWQLSRVRPLGKGEPGTTVKPPDAGLTWNALMVRSSVLVTNNEFVGALITMRSRP